MQPETKEYDPFENASAPVVRDFELYGQVDIHAWACALVTGQGKVPFDASIHEKRFTAIDVFIQPLAEIDVKYPKSLERHWIAESKEWANITLKSIKEAGFDNVREINGKWARVATVPNGKTYANRDGETKNEMTFKFIQFFNTENECRAAYLANGGQPSNGANGQTSAPVQTSEKNEKAQMYDFMKVIINQNVKSTMTLDQAKEVLASHASYSILAKFYTVDSPETLELINQVLKV